MPPVPPLPQVPPLEQVDRRGLPTAAQVCLSTFMILGLVAILNHALWRDEMQAWLLARDSDSLAEFWLNMAAEGHPALWHSLLALLQWVGTQPLGMQLMHWGFGSLSLWIFWRFSPFPTRAKILFTFGYFPFYEYFIFSRNYVLAELFTFLACACYPLRRKKPWLLALSLAFLANTHAFALFLVLGFLVLLVWDWGLAPALRRGDGDGLGRWTRLGSLGLVVLGFAWGAYSVSRASQGLGGDGGAGIDVQEGLRVLSRVLGGYTLLIPSRRWPDLLLCGGISLGLLGATALYVRRVQPALIFYLVATLSLLAFNYGIYLGGRRHWGFYYLILVAGLWLFGRGVTPQAIPEAIPEATLAFAQPEQTGDRGIGTARLSPSPPALPSPLAACVAGVEALYPRLFLLILIVQLVQGWVYLALDFKTPLSAGKATAHYIQAQGWAEQFMVASEDVYMSPLAGYLDRRLYYPEIQGQGSFTQWWDRVPVDRLEVLRQTGRLLETEVSGPILLILHYSLGELLLPAGASDLRIPNLESLLRLTPIAQFNRVNSQERGGDEQYWLYWVARVGSELESHD